MDAMISRSHVVLIPTFNTGPRLIEVVAAVLRSWKSVLVVVDGSTDGSALPVIGLAGREPSLMVLTLARNSGKGAAVLAGAKAALEKGFSHALVMDADGQHPVESIQEFMTASQRRPDAMILGRPIFPSNIPVERLHGRKLSVGLVHFELLGSGIADPLFGFRVYPIAPLLAELGTRRGGRRYDFDTEAAIRLGWAGVPPVNLSAPVRYFSRAEGGVSHFHYVRDNATLVWMHTRLIVELLFWRWPALLAHRRRWQAIGILPLLLLLGATRMYADPGDVDSLINPEHKLQPEMADWKNLAESFAHKPDTLADFTERRTFPFKKEGVTLKGEVRVSPEHGLSLHYLKPEERIVILDAKGMVLRAAAGEKTPPADPRATAANEALLHVLRFEFGALDRDFDLYGRKEGAAWELVLVPRAEAMRKSIGRITVTGEAASVSRIELRRSAKQAIEILIAPPKPQATFTPDEVKRFFR